jgi:nicotinate-nucleotide adenylyltransferase
MRCRPVAQLDKERLRRELQTPVMHGVEMLAAPALDISSTDIRRRAQAGLSLRYLTPDTVVGFIEKEQLYRKQAT